MIVCMIQSLFERDRPLIVFLPNLKYGGAEKVLLQAAREAAKSGRIVKIAVASNKGELLDEIPKEIELISLQRNRVLSSIIPLANVILNTKNAQVFTSMYHCNVICCFLKLFMPEMKLIIRESTSVDFYRSEFSPIRFHLLKIMVRFFYPRADIILFPSQHMFERFQSFVQMPEHKCKIIPNPLDKDFLESQSLEVIDESIWKKTKNKVLINVGRMDQNKNQILLLRAMALIPDKDFELLLIGDGPEIDRLKAEADRLRLSDRVRFLGFQKNPFKFLKSSDIFVLSSLREGYPNVLAQAKHFGLSIVSTDCPTGPREILSDWKQSLLVNANPEEMAEAIKRFLHLEN